MPGTADERVLLGERVDAGHHAGDSPRARSVQLKSSWKRPRIVGQSFANTA
jgi:hypothetical protein